MRNRAIGLCVVSILAASCGTSQPQPVLQEEPTQLSTRGSPVVSVRTLHSLAEQGNAEAQFNLGLLYDRGRRLPKDKAEALQWYRRAAMQGDTFAQNSLGDNYWEGTGLGKILAGGAQGVSADKPRAYMWLMLSAAQGDEEAGRQSEILLKQMKPAELLSAKKLINQWKPTRASVTVSKTVR
jgi:uncharacterized protein